MDNINKDIREIAQEILMLQKVATSLYVQNERTKLLDVIFNILSRADEVYQLSKSKTIDRLVVYVNSTSFVIRMLSDINDNKKAFEIGVDALHKSMFILLNTTAQNEEIASFKTLQLSQLLLIFYQLYSVESNRKVIDDEVQPFTDLQTLFVISFEDLRTIAPTNCLVSSCMSLYNSLKDVCTLDYCSYSSASAHSLYALSISLEQTLKRVSICNNYSEK